MTGQHIKVAATEGGEIDCYLSLPDSGPAPAVVVMASVFGVDGDVQGNCDDLAAQGFVAAAPDLFWRGDKGPMDRSEDGQRRARERAKDRVPMIEKGVQDLADTIAALKARPECNGRIAVVGLCYGGPFAVLGPARLGCDAGVSFHGTRVQDYIDEIDGVTVPVSLHWGDQDHAAPPEALEKIRGTIAGMANVEVHIYPGVLHGYTARASEKAWHEEAAGKSWRRCIEIVNGLRDKAEAAVG